MQYIEKLFGINDYKSKAQMTFQNMSCEFVCNDSEFGADQILKIIGFINEVHRRYKHVNVPIYFSFGKVCIIDKLTYIIFECICYWLITEHHHAISLVWNPDNVIWTQGVFSSPLKILNTQMACKESQIKFIEKFNFEIYQSHFRRVINPPKDLGENYVGRLQQDVNSFLRLFSIEEQYRDDVVEMIGEIVGNVAEHAQTDCLLDIDVTTDHWRADEPKDSEPKYYGVNIVILNFSNVLFGDKLGDRIRKNDLFEDSRYVSLKEAYDFHSEHFSDKYLFEDFCNLSSLQHKISGSPEKGLAGGKGLTLLIESLQHKSEDSTCYLLSGKRVVVFDKELLKYDDKEWLGFNHSHNFFSELPSKGVIDKCIVDFPGTAYNLNFVLKREANLDE